MGLPIALAWAAAGALARVAAKHAARLALRKIAQYAAKQGVKKLVKNMVDRAWERGKRKLLRKVADMKKRVSFAPLVLHPKKYAKRYLVATVQLRPASIVEEQRAALVAKSTRLKDIIFPQIKSMACQSTTALQSKWITRTT